MVSVCEVFLVCISLHLDWIRRNTLYFSVFSPNVGKYEPEKIRIRTVFTQCNIALSEQVLILGENHHLKRGKCYCHQIYGGFAANVHFLKLYISSHDEINNSLSGDGEHNFHGPPHQNAMVAIWFRGNSMVLQFILLITTVQIIPGFTILLL